MRTPPFIPHASAAEGRRGDGPAPSERTLPSPAVRERGNQPTLPAIPTIPVSTAAVTGAAAAAAGLGAEAVRAVHRPVTARLEGNTRLTTTRRAGGREHLTRAAPVATAAVAAAIAATTATAATIAPARIATLRTLCRAAVGATAGLIGEALGCMKLLFACREDEGIATIRARQCLVLVGHPMTSGPASPALSCYGSRSAPGHRPGKWQDSQVIERAARGAGDPLGPCRMCARNAGRQYSTTCARIPYFQQRSDTEQNVRLAPCWAFPLWMRGGRSVSSAAAREGAGV
jgi:hypothetical protein